MSLTQASLKQALQYDPNTGLFLRLTKYNASKKGSFLGSLQPHGYRTICVNYKKYYAHRLAWLYVFGIFPDEELDHINGDRSDNRIINLRAADRRKNSRNSSLRSDNTSGFKGVTWNRDCNKWLAQIQKEGVHYFLGVFDTIEVAAMAYDDEAIKLFGEFAKTNFDRTLRHVME